MNEESAFLRALEESPADRSLRLVFTDWLEEQGDPRGEMLRLLDTLTQSIKLRQRARLEARLQELLESGATPIGPFRTNSIGMRFAWIPAGTFLMGSPKAEEGRHRNEQRHSVVLTKGFFLGVHPVTRGEWRAIRDRVPGSGRKESPVGQVSWHACVAFCRRLSVLENQHYRLPTEAEWEYACRAGSTAAYCFGNDPGKLTDYAWYQDNANRKRHPVGEKKPNAFGLYDIHGHVHEWCSDWYADDYPETENVDPQGPESGTIRVLRGGNYLNPAEVCRCADRRRAEPTSTYSGRGFRVCWSLDSSPPF